MAFAEMLRQLRLDRFLSQAELGRRAGLHALTVTRLESGASAPTTRTVRALATALGVEPRELAAPEEVAELRRVLNSAERPGDRAGQALEKWADDGGKAGATGPTDASDSTGGQHG